MRSVAVVIKDIRDENSPLLLLLKIRDLKDQRQ